MKSFKRKQSKVMLLTVLGIGIVIVVFLLLFFKGRDSDIEHTKESTSKEETSLDIEVSSTEYVQESTSMEETTEHLTSTEEMTEETLQEESSQETTEQQTTKQETLPIPPTVPSSVAPPATEPTEEIEILDVSCSNYSLFSGQFVEDGRDELVENVAAMLVTNTSDKFLDLATLQYDINGKTATFVVTGLPAGRSAWVMEASKMTIPSNAVFTYVDCVTSVRDGVIAKSDKVTITADGNMLTATNNSQETLVGVFVYYKTLHTDGNFFGGISYVVDFGTLEPGSKSEEVLAGHYEASKTEIVRIGWQSN